MAYYLTTDCGHARYKVQGLPDCWSEWRLICAMHNLRKLWAHTKAQKAA